MISNSYHPQNCNTIAMKARRLALLPHFGPLMETVFMAAGVSSALTLITNNKYSSVPSDLALWLMVAWHDLVSNFLDH